MIKFCAITQSQIIFQSHKYRLYEHTQYTTWTVWWKILQMSRLSELPNRNDASLSLVKQHIILSSSSCLWLEGNLTALIEYLLLSTCHISLPSRQTHHCPSSSLLPSLTQKHPLHLSLMHPLLSSCYTSPFFTPRNPSGPISRKLSGSMAASFHTDRLRWK